MVALLITLAGLALAALAIVATGFVVGMRRKSPAVTGAVIAFAKRFVNPGRLRTAGQPGGSTGIVAHRGRRTGTEFATPVDIVDLDGAFVIALPYGTRSQWVRNVLAAGTAELTLDGRTWAVDRPELVPTDQVAGAFAPADRVLFRLLRTDRCLRLQRTQQLTSIAA